MDATAEQHVLAVDHMAPVHAEGRLRANAKPDGPGLRLDQRRARIDEAKPARRALQRAVSEFAVSVRAHDTHALPRLAGEVRLLEDLYVDASKRVTAGQGQPAAYRHRLAERRRGCPPQDRAA